MNLTNIYEDASLVLGLTQSVGDPELPCGVGCRCGLDPTLLWLWHRLVAIAPIRPIAWELPYVMGTALKSSSEKKNDIQ